MRAQLSNPTFLNRWFPKDEEGFDQVALAFYFSFYFADGYRQEYRRRAVDVCTDYWRLCGQHLQWMITPLRSHWKRVPPGYSMDRWASSYPDKDWVWSMIFHAGRITSEAASYGIVGVGNSTQTHGCSNLFLFVPVTWFVDHAGEHPIGLYQRWAAMLQARHGTAGIGLVPPEDSPKRGATSGLARAFGQQFPGTELADFIGGDNALYGLRSPNWLNLIDHDYLEQLGGLDTVRGHLDRERLGHIVGMHSFDGGVIFSAGEAPSLRDDEDSELPPSAYGPVARLLKPLRTPEPWGSWGCPKDESLRWMARFD